MPPPRLQGFEFCDQPWFNGFWREAYLDGLSFLFRMGGIYRRMHGPFSRWTRQAGGTHVLDLASGGAGPIETLLRSARDAGAAMPRITLSDLFPDVASYRRLQASFPEQVDYIAEPVDARTPCAAGRGMRLRSICTGFHHFSPAQARELLAGVTERSDGIFIMEPTRRSWLAMLLPLLTFFPLMLAPFFARRFSLRQLLVSTVIPIVPLLIVFDGTVSALRMYRPEEILAMLPEAARETWVWEWGTQRCLLIFQATYLFGVFHSLTGEPPFEGGGPKEVLGRRLVVDPPDPSAYNPEIPREMADICLKMMARDPADRFQTYAELIQPLKKFTE